MSPRDSPLRSYHLSLVSLSWLLLSFIPRLQTKNWRFSASILHGSMSQSLVRLNVDYVSSDQSMLTLNQDSSFSSFGRNWSCLRVGRNPSWTMFTSPRDASWDWSDIFDWQKVSGTVTFATEYSKDTSQMMLITLTTTRYKDLWSVDFMYVFDPCRWYLIFAEKVVIWLKIRFLLIQYVTTLCIMKFIEKFSFSEGGWYLLALLVRSRSFHITSHWSWFVARQDFSFLRFAVRDAHTFCLSTTLHEKISRYIEILEKTMEQLNLDIDWSHLHHCDDSLEGILVCPFVGDDVYTLISQSKTTMILNLMINVLSIDQVLHGLLQYLHMIMLLSRVHLSNWLFIYDKLKM